jgi:hypothetical protein
VTTPQVALVFGYRLSVYVEGELEELPGEEEAQQQPLPLSLLQVNLGAARGRVLSGGRTRAAAAGVGAGGALAPSLKASVSGQWGQNDECSTAREQFSRVLDLLHSVDAPSLGSLHMTLNRLQEGLAFTLNACTAPFLWVCPAGPLTQGRLHLAPLSSTEEKSSSH